MIINEKMTQKKNEIKNKKATIYVYENENEKKILEKKYIFSLWKPAQLCWLPQGLYACLFFLSLFCRVNFCYYHDYYCMIVELYAYV